MLEGGPHDHCALHEQHVTTSVVVDSCSFSVFAAHLYEGTSGYCAGDDEVSRGILHSGTWEKYGTALARAALADAPQPDEAVIDFGCHFGWYAVMAARAGFDVLAVDADDEHLRVLGINAQSVGVEDRIAAVRGWIGPTTARLDATAAPRVRLLKIDLEGEDGAALDVTGALLRDQLVEYALVEFSPVFGVPVMDLIERVRGYGYAAFLVPIDGEGIDLAEFAANPIGVTVSQGEVHSADWPQRDVLFIRHGGF
jgi:hypothetical protein